MFRARLQGATRALELEGVDAAELLAGGRARQVRDLETGGIRDLSEG